MAVKAQFYAQLADQTARQITGSYRAWTAFLTTAARLYKYPYHEQLMIYAQRPEATACAEYDFWNQRMGRYVRRGSKGIALVDSRGCVTCLMSRIQEAENRPAAPISGSSSPSTIRRYGRLWRTPLAWMGRRPSRTSWRSCRSSWRQTTGRSTRGRSLPSLTVPFWRSMMRSTSGRRSAVPPA